MRVAEGTDRIVPPDLPIFLQYDDVVIGIRIVLATAENGGQARATLVCDGDGGACGVMRITCTHANQAPQAGGMVGIWMGCLEDVTPETFLRFQAHFAQDVAVDINGGRVSLRVPGWQEDMRVVVDVDAQARLENSGGICDPSEVLFSVNGHEIGKDLLADI